MADYKKMYIILCGAIDDVIEPMKVFQDAKPFAFKLQNALERAEEVYMQTSFDEDEK